MNSSTHAISPPCRLENLGEPHLPALLPVPPAAARLGVSLLITVLIAGFIFRMSRTVGMRPRGPGRGGCGARGAIIPLLVFQGLILFVLGTAQVAGGMTAERDEGVIDYQRLIPMSPLSKVLGYLFGLPVREYVMFLATLPFTAWALWRGEVAWRSGCRSMPSFLPPRCSIISPGWSPAPW